MDDGQRWAVAAARAALTDAGWPNWDVDPERVAVILGNAIGGEKHYATNLRIQLPEVLRELQHGAVVRGPAGGACASRSSTRPASSSWPSSSTSPRTRCPASSPTSSPAGSPTCSTSAGPNFTTDAACASALAATSAVGARAGRPRCDAVVTGGVDRNMGVAAFVKFCKIGALSATGTRPFDAGADGFVMGEGAALFVLKRLADAERDGDRIYAVLLGVGGSSDGKGKGITAPNPRRSAARRRAGLAAGRRRPGDRRLRRGARHVDPRRRRRRAREPHRRVRRRPGAAPAPSRSAR